MTWAEAVHDSPYGRIESSWRVIDDTFRLTTTVPPGTSAEIRRRALLLGGRRGRHHPELHRERDAVVEEPVRRHLPVLDLHDHRPSGETPEAPDTSGELGWNSPGSVDYGPNFHRVHLDVGDQQPWAAGRLGVTEWAEKNSLLDLPLDLRTKREGILPCR